MIIKQSKSIPWTLSQGDYILAQKQTNLKPLQSNIFIRIIIFIIFLRTARSFYDSLWHLRTYIHTYELTYLRTYILTNILTNKSLLKKSSYTKTSLTKKVPNDTSTCSKFFFRCRNPKNDRDRAKKTLFFDQKLRFICFFLKNLQVNPTWNFPNFSQYFS